MAKGLRTLPWELGRSHRGAAGILVAVVTAGCPSAAAAAPDPPAPRAELNGNDPAGTEGAGIQASGTATEPPQDQAPRDTRLGHLTPEAAARRLESDRSYADEASASAQAATLEELRYFWAPPRAIGLGDRHTVEIGNIWRLRDALTSAYRKTTHGAYFPPTQLRELRDEWAADASNDKSVLQQTMEDAGWLVANPSGLALEAGAAWNGATVRSPMPTTRAHENLHRDYELSPELQAAMDTAFRLLTPEAQLDIIAQLAARGYELDPADPADLHATMSEIYARSRGRSWDRLRLPDALLTALYPAVSEWAVKRMLRDQIDVAAVSIPQWLTRGDRDVLYQEMLARQYEQWAAADFSGQLRAEAEARGVRKSERARTGDPTDAFCEGARTPAQQHLVLVNGSDPT